MPHENHLLSAILCSQVFDRKQPVTFWGKIKAAFKSLFASKTERRLAALRKKRPFPWAITKEEKRARIEALVNDSKKWK